MKDVGLKEQIEAAISPSEVDKLLAVGRGFRYASDSTRRKWARAAEDRIARLKAEEARAK